MADLFELTDLAAKLQTDLDTASAFEARRSAQAWLARATQLNVWPSPIPEDLRAWALELAGLIYDNPSNKSSETVDNTSSVWALARRKEILTEAALTYSGYAGTQYSFPATLTWPDPIEGALAGRDYYWQLP
jgi:hypothetical protein